MSTGAEDANEAMFRRELLAKLDRIIKLLTPATSTYECHLCHALVAYGFSHNCVRSAGQMDYMPSPYVGGRGQG